MKQFHWNWYTKNFPENKFNDFHSPEKEKVGLKECKKELFHNKGDTVVYLNTYKTRVSTKNET